MKESKTFFQTKALAFHASKNRYYFVLVKYGKWREQINSPPKLTLDKKMPSDIAFLMLNDVMIELESYESSLAVSEAA